VFLTPTSARNGPVYHTGTSCSRISYRHFSIYTIFICFHFSDCISFFINVLPLLNFHFDHCLSSRNKASKEIRSWWAVGCNKDTHQNYGRHVSLLTATALITKTRKLFHTSLRTLLTSQPLGLCEWQKIAYHYVADMKSASHPYLLSLWFYNFAV
jgi:hypothetical protein